MALDNKNITLHGNPIEVSGTVVKVGDKVPNFTLTNNDLKDVSYTDFKGKTIVLSVVPSLDTPTCSIQTKRFNQEAAALGENVVILTVSRDLPFAQKRWCGAEGVSQVTTLSDYKLRTFGQLFGVDVANISLLARAVFVVNAEAKLTYVEYVDEVSKEPNYDNVIAAVKSSL